MKLSRPWEAFIGSLLSLPEIFFGLRCPMSCDTQVIGKTWEYLRNLMIYFFSGSFSDSIRGVDEALFSSR